MQDRTIDNSLLALAKQGGQQGKLAEVLLMIRGVEWSGWYQIQPNKLGDTKRLIMEALAQGPHTNIQLGKIMQTPKAAANMTYQALFRLKDQGRVLRSMGQEGCLWRVAVA